jgi:hypothetical protein
MITRPLTISTIAIFALAAAGCASDGSLTTSALQDQKPASAAPKVDPQCVTLAAQIDQLRKEGSVERLEKAASGSGATVAVKRASISKQAELNKANLDYQAKCSTIAPKPVTATAPAPAPAAPATPPATKPAAKSAAVAPAAAAVTAAPAKAAAPVAAAVKAAPSAATAAAAPATAVVKTIAKPAAAAAPVAAAPQAVPSPVTALPPAAAPVIVTTTVPPTAQ